jgi:hypothetical protein
MASSFQKFDNFVLKLAHGAHNLGSNQLVAALCNTAPIAANSVLTDLTQIGSYAFLSSRNITTTSSTQTSGTYKLVLQDLVLTSTGGPTGPFRYVAIYDDTAASDDLVGFYDYGSSITLADGETLTLDFDASAGVLQLA